MFSDSWFKVINFSRLSSVREKSVGFLPPKKSFLMSSVHLSEESQLSVHHEKVNQ